MSEQSYVAVVVALAAYASTMYDVDEPTALAAAQQTVKVGDIVPPLDVLLGQLRANLWTT